MIDYSQISILPELYSDNDSENDSDYSDFEDSHDSNDSCYTSNFKLIDPIVLQTASNLSSTDSNTVSTTTLRIEKDKLMSLVVKLTVKKLLTSSSSKALLQPKLTKFLENLVKRSKISFKTYLKFLSLLMIEESNSVESPNSNTNLANMKKKILFLLIISDANNINTKNKGHTSRNLSKNISHWSVVSGYPKDKLSADLTHFELVHNLSFVDINLSELKKTSVMVKRELRNFVKIN